MGMPSHAFDGGRANGRKGEGRGRVARKPCAYG
jgi:hypothetical protein